MSRIAIKIFIEETSSTDILELVPVFHRWISEQAIEDHLLIDVADYTHVWRGPKLLLVAHEANYAMDQADERLGLLYQRKQPLEGEIQDRLRTAFIALLKACVLLEEEFNGELKFRGNEMVFIANDRLSAPNTEDSFLSFKEEISTLLFPLFESKEISFTRKIDPKERLTIHVKAPQPAVEIKSLLDSLS